MDDVNPEQAQLGNPWLDLDIDRLDDLNFDDDEEEEEETDYDSDGSSDDTSSTTSSNEVQVPLFNLVNDGEIIDNDEEEDGEEDENLLQGPHPFAPFGLFGAEGLNNFMDVFRRIAYGLNATRSSIQLDTLPAPRPHDPEKIDLYDGNLPPLGSIPMHRNFLIPPFTNVIVSFYLLILHF